MAAVKPLLDVGELVQVHARPHGYIGPADDGHVSDGELVAHDVVAAGQARVEDAVEALCLAYVALDGIGGLVFAVADEVVCLALPVWGRQPCQSYAGKKKERGGREKREGENVHGTQSTMLPGHPLLGLAVLVAVDGEAELVLRVVVAREVGQDREALEDGEAAAIVVDDDGDAPVGVEVNEPGLLLRVLHDVDRLARVLGAVGVLELLEEDGGLEAVWCA